MEKERGFLSSNALKETALLLLCKVNSSSNARNSKELYLDFFLLFCLLNRIHFGNNPTLCNVRGRCVSWRSQYHENINAGGVQSMCVRFYSLHHIL